MKRARRLRERRSDIERSTAALSALRRDAGISWVLLRDAFVFHRSPFEQQQVLTSTAPPVASLTATNEEALRLYLVGLFVAQCFKTPGREPGAFASMLSQSESGPRSWGSLLALPSTLRNQRLRIDRAMIALDRLRLGRPGPGTGRDRRLGFELLAENQSGEPYRLPGGRFTNVVGTRRSGGSAFVIPTTFFTRGWVLALSGSEIAVYLMLRHAHERFRRRYVYVPRTERLQGYRISDEVYRAHRELAEFGLVRRGDSMSRRRGRISPIEGQVISPFRFELRDDRVDRAAVGTILRALGTATPAPHLRLAERPNSNPLFGVDGAGEQLRLLDDDEDHATTGPTEPVRVDPSHVELPTTEDPDFWRWYDQEFNTGDEPF
jgi:hypothetical protein